MRRRGKRMGGWVAAAHRREEEGTNGKGGGKGGRNFARARLHPPRLPPPPPSPPPLDAEGSWTARVRCQFCARSPPWRCQPARDLPQRVRQSGHARSQALSLAVLPSSSDRPFVRTSSSYFFSPRFDDGLLWNGTLSEKLEGGLSFLDAGRENRTFEPGTWHASAGDDYHAGRDLRGQQCTWKIARDGKFGRVRTVFFPLVDVNAATDPEREGDVSGRACQEEGNKIVGCVALIPEYTRSSFRSLSAF